MNCEKDRPSVSASELWQSVALVHNEADPIGHMIGFHENILAIRYIYLEPEFQCHREICVDTERMGKNLVKNWRGYNYGVMEWYIHGTFPAIPYDSI